MKLMTVVNRIEGDMKRLISGYMPVNSLRLCDSVSVSASASCE